VSTGLGKNVSADIVERKARLMQLSAKNVEKRYHDRLTEYVANDDISGARRALIGIINHSHFCCI
jgi:hypothetical protein